MIGRTPGPHPGDPAAQGRRDRRLRHLREDAPLLHPAGALAPLGEAPHGHLRAVGHHRRRAAGGAGGGRVRRRAQAGLHHRGADGRRDRRGAPGARAGRATWSSTSVAAPPRSRSSRSAASSSSESIRIAGDELDDAIITYVKKEYSLALGERTAEEIKVALASAYPLEEELYAEIRGRDLVTGLPKTIVVSTEEIREAVEEPVSAIVDAVKVTLDKTPPELAADIMEKGIVITGGGALLHGLDHRLHAETGHADRGRPEPAVFGRDRLRPVPRGVRRTQAGAHVLAAGLTEPRGAPELVAVYRRTSRRRSVLILLVLTSITLITVDARGNGGGVTRTVRDSAARRDGPGPVGGRRHPVAGRRLVRRRDPERRPRSRRTGVLRRQLAQARGEAAQSRARTAREPASCGGSPSCRTRRTSPASTRR